MGFLNVVIQFYNEKNLDRKQELLIALMQNLNNKYIKKVINLIEKDNNCVPEEIKQHEKYGEFFLGKWYTYKDVFDYCNTNLNGEYCCIINLDMILDEKCNWNNIRNDLDNKYVYALSRHEFDYINNRVELDQNFVRLYHAHTQDGWFFKTPVNIMDCDFEIGMLGCDNAIADRINRAGYKLMNKAIEYKLLHIDMIKGKNSGNFLDFHNKEKKQNNIINRHPEKEGQYLVPIYELVENISLDNLMRQMKVSNEERYKIVCDIISMKIKIKN